ncbi:hypothetical protein EQV77_12030 [Halobacillus fulvus]|nr:hypothetical protein EQV77_12030 [Halobacillus fulvus]
MKKHMLLLLSTLAILLFATACSSSEAEKLDDIYQKAAEASEELKSFAMTIDSEQIIEMTGAESTDEANPFTGGMPIQTTIESEMQTDPVAFYQTIEMMGQTMEQYYTPEGLYMTSPLEDGWMKAPKEFVDQLNTMSAQQQTPADQLDMLKDYVDEFSLETEGSNYILTFTSEGENVQNLIEDSLKETMPEGQMPADIMESMTVNKVDYQFVIDQETYYPQTMDVEMDFTVDENGEQMNIKQSLHGEYSRFNEIEEITVPQEIIDEAKEIDMEGF